jgi:hypothetical protein
MIRHKYMEIRIVRESGQSDQNGYVAKIIHLLAAVNSCKIKKYVNLR